MLVISHFPGAPRIRVHQFRDVLAFVDTVKYFVDGESVSVRSAAWHFVELVGVRAKEDKSLAARHG